MPDLLPDDYGTATLQPPVALLREQAGLFAAKTNGLVLARVNTAKFKDDQLIQQFVLEVPALEGYTYHLFSTIHSFDFYPIYLDCPIVHDGVVTRIGSQEQFEDELRQLFAHRAVRNIVTALIAQAKVPGGAEEEA